MKALIIICLLVSFAFPQSFTWPVNSGDPGVANPALAAAKDAENIARIEEFLSHAIHGEVYYVKSLTFYYTDSSEALLLYSRNYSITRSFAHILGNDAVIDSFLVDAVHFTVDSSEVVIEEETTPHGPSAQKKETEKRYTVRQFGLTLPNIGLPEKYRISISFPKPAKDEVKKVYAEKVVKVNADYIKYKDKAVKGSGIKVKESGGSQKTKKFANDTAFRKFCWGVVNEINEIKE